MAVGRAAQCRCDRVEIERRPPRRTHACGSNAVGLGNAAYALAVHTVLGHQQPPALRHHAGDHRFYCRRPRTRQQGRRPFGGRQCIHRQQFVAQTVLQRRELHFTVTQVRPRQRRAHPRTQGHRSRIEQDGSHAALPMCCMSRARTAGGVMAGRGRSSRAPVAIFICRKALPLCSRAARN